LLYIAHFFLDMLQNFSLISEKYLAENNSYRPTLWAHWRRKLSAGPVSRGPPT